MSSGVLSRIPGPLNGVKILDLSRYTYASLGSNVDRVLAGPFATRILCDLGATVIKVESSVGDDSRAFGPFVDGFSAYFMSLNVDKKSISSDLKKVFHYLTIIGR